MQGNKLINKKEQAIKGDQSTYNCGCGRSQQKKIKEKTTPPRLGHYCDIMSYLLLEPLLQSVNSLKRTHSGPALGVLFRKVSALEEVLKRDPKNLIPNTAIEGRYITT